MIYYYGGAFNPLTKAHQKIIDNLVKKLDIQNDQIIIGVTSYQDKEYSYPDRIRYDMAYNYMFKKYIPLIEQKHIFIKWQVLYQYYRTYDYLKQLKDMFKTDSSNITIVIGEDEWKDLNDKKWEHSEQLLDEYKFKVIPRKNDISSTKVRELLTDKDVNYSSLKKYISKEVYDVIH